MAGRHSFAVLQRLMHGVVCGDEGWLQGSSCHCHSHRRLHVLGKCIFTVAGASVFLLVVSCLAWGCIPTKIVVPTTDLPKRGGVLYVLRFLPHVGAVPARKRKPGLFAKQPTSTVQQKRVACKTLFQAPCPCHGRPINANAEMISDIILRYPSGIYCSIAIFGTWGHNNGNY